CGIYNLYFWYKYAEDKNTTCQGDGEETTNYIIAWLLGIVTCSIYIWYWYYKLGNRLQRNAPRYNLAFQENGTTVILWMLVGSLLCGIGMFVAYHILIKNMNAIGNSYNALNAQYGQPQVNVNVYAEQQNPPQEPPPQA
ncbi:MAG: DUF4234 domain-containing protein, partial [Oscillospiraceae bacterium]